MLTNDWYGATWWRLRRRTASRSLAKCGGTATEVQDCSALGQIKESTSALPTRKRCERATARRSGRQGSRQSWRTNLPRKLLKSMRRAHCTVERGKPLTISSCSTSEQRPKLQVVTGAIGKNVRARNVARCRKTEDYWERKLPSRVESCTSQIQEEIP